MSRLIGRWLQSLGGKDGGPRGTESENPSELAAAVVRLYEAGRYGEAEAAARRLVERQRQIVGERHPDYGTALSNHGLLLQKLGRLDEAEPLLRQSLEVRREALGDLHPHYAASLNHLAELLQLRGNLAAAEPLLRQALEIRGAALGERHPDYATGLTSLALLLHRKGDLPAAEPLLRQALTVRREALGERHPQYATALANVAMVLQRRKALDEAEPLLRQALEVRREALGPQHPDFGASLSMLAHLLLERRNLPAAEQLLSQAVEVRRAVFGEQNPEVRDDLEILGKVREALGAGKPTAAPPSPKAPETLATPTPKPTPLPKAPETLATPRVTPPTKAAPPPPPPPPAPPIVEAPPRPKRGTREIATDLRRLQETFGKVATGLRDASKVMAEQGLPPEPALLEQATACNQALANLGAELEHLTAIGLPPLRFEEGRRVGLNRLLEEVESRSRAEEARARRSAMLEQAWEVLDHVRSLSHDSPGESGSLERGQQAATTLSLAIEGASPDTELPPEVTSLAEGNHPLALLLRLSSTDDSIDDSEWARLYKGVASAFGTPLAAAAARRRITPSPRGPGFGKTSTTPTPGPTEEPTPTTATTAAPIEPATGASSMKLGAASPAPPTVRGTSEVLKGIPGTSQEFATPAIRVMADRPPLRLTLADLTDAVFDDGAAVGRAGKGQGPIWISLGNTNGHGPTHPRFPGNIQWPMN